MNSPTSMMVHRLVALETNMTILHMFQVKLLKQLEYWYEIDFLLLDLNYDFKTIK